MTLNFLLFCVDVKRTQIQKLNVVSQIILAMFSIGAEGEQFGNPKHFDEECPRKVAFHVMNCVGISLPPDQVFPAVKQVITTRYAIFILLTCQIHPIWKIWRS
jgi:hypothetical protein